MLNYSFELKLNTNQRRFLSQTAGAVRFVWNHFLAEQKAIQESRNTIYHQNKERIEQGLDPIPQQPLLSFNDCCKALTALKRAEGTQWLKQPIAQALQQTLRDQDRAIRESFKNGKGFPRFKSRDHGDSFRLPQPKAQDIDEANARVFVPKLGYVRYRKSRDTAEGLVRQVTIKRDGTKWFVVITKLITNYQPLETLAGECGIDLGVAQTVTTSDGKVYQIDTDRIKAIEKQIAQKQRVLSHNYEARRQLAKSGLAQAFDKTKPSRKRRRLKVQIQKLYQKLRNIRKDFCQQTANAIARTVGMVYVEDLKIRNMTASAKGTIEEPGRRVKQKSGLNKAMLRFSPHQLVSSLEWALLKHGGYMTKVNPAYTSQTCPSCGHCEKENRPTQAEFKCRQCGYANNADVVGAINVLNRGGQSLRCLPSEPTSVGQQQEPTEGGVQVKTCALPVGIHLL